jgi:hypothetical protein
VHIAGTFRFAAQNGRQSYNYKNLARLSQVKLLVGFQRRFTLVINTIPSCGEMSTKIHRSDKNYT